MSVFPIHIIDNYNELSNIRHTETKEREREPLRKIQNMNKNKRMTNGRRQ